MRQLVYTALALVVLAGAVPGLSLAQPATPASSGPVIEPNPVAPPFKPDMVVVDRTGARIGVVQSVTETTGGPNVVIKVEGKLVGVPPTTLKLQGQTVISNQTKAEILASAGAPR